MTTAHSKSLKVKIPLSYQDAGCEEICDLLLNQKSQTARTRLFRNLVIRAWHKALVPFAPPSPETKQRWLTSPDHLALNLQVNATDPSTAGLYVKLAQLPDHRSRVAAVRRLLFDALYHYGPAGSAQDSNLLPFVQLSAPAPLNSSPVGGSTHAPSPPPRAPDSHATPPAPVAARPERAPEPAVPPATSVDESRVPPTSAAIAVKQPSVTTAKPTDQDLLRKRNAILFSLQQNRPSKS